MTTRRRVVTTAQRVVLLAAACALAACAAAPPGSDRVAPLAAVFPTMTPGAAYQATLAPARAVGAPGNPATAIAQANAPTATPDLRECPTESPTAALPAAPPTSSAALESMAVAFLGAGGSPAALETGLRGWGLLGGSGRLTRDLDVTGEGTPDVIVSAIAPGEGGLLMVLVCAGGAVGVRYTQVTGGDAPHIANAADMNNDGLPELLYTSLLCGLADAASETGCEYIAYIATWDRARGRLINLFDRPLRNAELPTLEDYDDDQVTEVIARFTFTGDAETGPLRTGFTVYDWNGVVYTRSITQLEPPRFRVQVVRQADAALRAGNTTEAEGLYRLAATDDLLDNWQNDDSTVLRAYALYRLLITQAAAGSPLAAETAALITQGLPDEMTAPIYPALARRFWDAYSSSRDLRAACLAVLDLAVLRPEAIALMNRYGETAPRYTADDLCPFAADDPS
jgi:hypothetical protein